MKFLLHVLREAWRTSPGRNFLVGLAIVVRIAIARALATEGDVVVLDEPTSGLDAAMRAKVWELIERRAEHAPIVVATHDETAPIREGDVVFRPHRKDA